MLELRLFEMRLKALIPDSWTIDRAALRRHAPGIAVALAILILAHLSLWFYMAHLAETRVERYLAAHTDLIGAKAVGIGGYPFHMEARLSEVTLHRDQAVATAPVILVRIGLLAPTRYTIVATDGLTLTYPGLEASAHHLRLTGRESDGRDGDTDLQIGGLAFGGAAPVFTADSLGLQIASSASQPATDTGETARFTLVLSEIRLAGRFGDLGSTVGEIHANGSVDGRFPQSGGRAALIGWRDAGGTIELPKIGLSWGKLSIAAEGTLALDKELQPQAALSATVDGWPALIDALAASGSMNPTEARIIRFGLSMLSPPESGQSLKVPITLQNGQIYLEKAKIGRVPRIDWPNS